MTYWQVYNARGRMYLAEGDTAQEAIDNARPLFASNWLDAGRGQKMANPEFAQVGMTAVALTVDIPDDLGAFGRALGRTAEAYASVLPTRSPFWEHAQGKGIAACWCPPMEDASDPGQHQTGCLGAQAIRIDRLRKEAFKDWDQHRRQLWGRSWSPPSIPWACYEASFGWVHVQPSCRCSRGR